MIRMRSVTLWAVLIISFSVWLAVPSVLPLKFLYSHVRPEPVDGRVIWTLRLCSGQALRLGSGRALRVSSWQASTS